MIDYILIGIALIWILFASIQDIKTREVSDWLSYSLITIGIFIRIIYYIIYDDLWFLLWGLIGGLVFFLFGYLMYYTKQWGGGDVKLLIGIGTTLGTYPITLLNYFNPNLNINFLGILIINIFFVGGIWGLVYASYVASKNWKKFKTNFKNPNEYYFILIGALLISGVFLEFNLKLIFWISGIFILISIYLFKFVKAVEECMYHRLNYDKLTEGDWITKSIYYKGKLIYKPERLGLSKDGLNLLKKYKVKDVLVKDGIPFVPAFFFGILISLILGNLI